MLLARSTSTELWKGVFPPNLLSDNENNPLQRPVNEAARNFQLTQHQINESNKEWIKCCFNFSFIGTATQQAVPWSIHWVCPCDVVSGGDFWQPSGESAQQIEIEHKKKSKKENQTGQLSRGPKIDRMGHLMRPFPVDPFIDWRTLFSTENSIIWPTHRFHPFVWRHFPALTSRP